MLLDCPKFIWMEMNQFATSTQPQKSYAMEWRPQLCCNTRTLQHCTSRLSSAQIRRRYYCRSITFSLFAEQGVSTRPCWLLYPHEQSSWLPWLIIMSCADMATKSKNVRISLIRSSILLRHSVIPTNADQSLGKYEFIRAASLAVLSLDAN